MTKITKKSQGISLNVILIAIIALIVFIILIAFVTGQFDKFNPEDDVCDKINTHTSLKYDATICKEDICTSGNCIEWHKANPCELCSEIGDCSQEVSEGKCVCDEKIKVGSYAIPSYCRIGYNCSSRQSNTITTCERWEQSKSPECQTRLLYLCTSSHLKTLKDLSIPELRKAYDEKEYKICETKTHGKACLSGWKRIKKSDIVTELIKRIDGDT